MEKIIAICVMTDEICGNLKKILEKEKLSEKTVRNTLTLKYLLTMVKGEYLNVIISENFFITKIILFYFVVLFK